MRLTMGYKNVWVLMALAAAVALGAGMTVADNDNAPTTMPAASSGSASTAAPTTAPATESVPMPATTQGAIPATMPTTMPAGGGMPSSGSGGSGGSSAGGSGNSGPGAASGGAAGGGASSSGTSTTTSGSAASTSAFVGEVAASNVNVRSGPGLRYYVIGQLGKSDLVNVIAEHHGWYAISAPVGARCYVAKQFVKANSTGDRGTITSRFVNLRAASALTPTSDYAVVGLARRGQRVSVVGKAGMFYIIRAPAHTHFYVYSTFIKPAPAGSTYIGPQLRMPAGFSATGAAALTPAAIASGPSAGAAAMSSSAASTQPASNGAVPMPAAESGSASPAPAPLTPMSITPAKTYNPSAYKAFSKLDKALVAEFKKPLLQRKLKPLQSGFKKLLAKKHLPASIRSATKMRLKEISRMMQIQAIAQSPVTTAPVTATIAPYQQQWEKSKAILEKSIATEPFLAKGVLAVSHTINKFAVLNPQNGRVVAYIQPPHDMDLSKLLGSYVGIKGLVISKTGTFIRVIKANSATLLPNPNP